MKRIGWIRSIGLGCMAAGTALGAAIPDDSIDARTVLEIGPLRISSYLVDKYYGRFNRRKGADPQSEAASVRRRKWFELYLSQQVMIADSERAGYLDRGPVKAMVDRMERSMLGEIDQACWDRDQPEGNMAPDELDRLNAESRVLTDCVLVRIRGGVDPAAVLGPDFMGIAAAEGVRRARSCRGDDRVTVFEGTATWPFGEFSEIEAPIRAAKTGTWWAREIPGLGHYYILVRGRSTARGPAPGASREQFAAFAKAMRRQMLAHRHGLEILEETGSAIDAESAGALQAFLKALPEGTPELPAMPAALAEAPLVRFTLGGQAQTADAGDYRGYFNDLFLRVIPGTSEEVRRSIDDMVVERFEVRDARARGMDHARQFAEDRSGFLGYQALDLYEREVLLPQLRIGDDAVARYYSEHAGQYLRATRVRGRRLEFASMADALGWLRSGGGGIRPTGDAPAEVSDQDPLTPVRPLQKAVMEGPPGMRIGPVASGLSFVIFIKTGTVATAPVPLGEAAPRIRDTLERSALDALELSLAPRMCAQLEVQDRIDYGRYGLTASELKRPWSL